MKTYTHTPGSQLAASHFARLWADRHNDAVADLNGHRFDREQRRQSVRSNLRAQRAFRAAEARA